MEKHTNGSLIPLPEVQRGSEALAESLFQDIFKQRCTRNLNRIVLHHSSNRKVFNSRGYSMGKASSMLCHVGVLRPVVWGRTPMPLLSLSFSPTIFLLLPPFLPFIGGLSPGPPLFHLLWEVSGGVIPAPQYGVGP